MKAKTYVILALTLSMIPGVLFAASISRPSQTPQIVNQQLTSEYETYPYYYYGPRLHEITITSYSDAHVEFLALRGGDIDAQEFQLLPSDIPVSQHQANLQTNVSNDLGFYNLPVNAGRFPGNHIGFRRALADMINYADLISHDLQGYGGQMATNFPAAFPSAYKNSSTPIYTFDLAKANQELLNDHFFYDSGSSAWYFEGNMAGGTPGTCVKANPVGTNCAKIDPAQTIFVSRKDDPTRDYIGTQLENTITSTASTYHFDKLFSITHQVKSIAFTIAYKAPSCTGGSYYGNPSPYNETNCSGTGLPTFTSYTQGASPSTADPVAFLYFTYSNDPGIGDSNYLNFGHWINATINDDNHRLFFTVPVDNALVRKIDGETTTQAWNIPLFYLVDYTASSDRITGHQTAQNSGQCCGSFYENNPFSFFRGHLKGVTFGGTMRLGSYSPINQLSQYNPDSNWVFDAQLFNRIYSSLAWLDPNTGSYLPVIAQQLKTTLLPAPARLYQGACTILCQGFAGNTTAFWVTSSTAPYLVPNPTFYADAGHYADVGPGATKIDFLPYTNATWHDGSPITANDIVWNIRTIFTDPLNFLQPNFAGLEDVNITSDLGPNTVTLWFAGQSSDFLLGAALNNLVPPLTWIHHSTVWSGNVSYVSLTSASQLNLTAGKFNMLDGSGPFKYDTASVGSPFITGNTFDILANTAWLHNDPAMAGYSTGIRLMSPYLPITTPVDGGSTLSLQVAITNSANSKGLKFDVGHSDLVYDSSTTSDTSTASVTASVVDINGNPAGGSTPLTYDSGSKLYTGSLVVPSPTSNTVYYVQISATNTGSIATTYGPAGTSVASPTVNGISWEGDPLHTAFLVKGSVLPTPVTAIQILLLTLTASVAAAVAVRVKRVRL